MGRIGPTELIIILVILLLVLGPRKLPELARAVGRGIKEFRGGLQEAGADTGPRAQGAQAGGEGPAGERASWGRASRVPAAGRGRVRPGR